VASKATEKPTAASRSAIRRHRTLRGPHARPHAAETRRRRILSMVADAAPEDYEVWQMQRTSPPDDGELTFVGNIQDRAQRMFEAGQARLRDTLSFERQHPHSRPTNSEIDGPLMPPVPESRDYSSLEDRQQRLRNISRRIAARNSAPTPPYTGADLSALPPTGPLSPGPISLTPALSPVRQSPPYDAESAPRRPIPNEEYGALGSIGGNTYSGRRPHRIDVSITTM